MHPTRSLPNGVARTLRALSLLFCTASTGIAQAGAPALAIGPHTLRTYDGVEHAIELGRIALPESRGRTGGPTVTVAFYRLRSTASAPGSPTVFLMGGPGIATSLIAPIPPYWTLFDGLRAVGDVILLDQRGLGLSTPVVDCPAPAARLDTNLLTSAAALLTAYRGVVANCAEHWRSKGVDPRAYSDDAVADDVDDIRAALGAARVNLLGFSYGTRLAMAYVRRHTANVDRVVLQGSTDGELSYRSSLQFDTLLARFARHVEADSAAAPFSRSLAPRLGALFDRAAREPVGVRIRTVRGDSLEVPVGREGLQALVSGHLADPRIPALVATLEARDLTILTRWVEGLYNDFSNGGGSMMARALGCSTPPSAARRAQVDAEGARSLFGPSGDNFSVTEPFCSALGGSPPPPTPRAAVPVARPALFVTGENDDRTPPSNAAVLAREFARPVTLVVENGGHELLVTRGVRDAVIGFLGGRDVRGLVLREPAPRFLSIEAAKLPPRRPGQ